MKTNAYFYLAGLLVLGFITCQSDSVKSNPKTETGNIAELDTMELFNQKMEVWVENQFKTLSEEQKITQLFMLGAYPNQGAVDEAKILSAIQKQQIGGLIFFKTNPTRLAYLTNLYQKNSKVPLLMAIDGEWGMSMRVDSAVVYPRQLTMGAVRDNNLIYRFGQQVAKEAKLLGIHVNFAPVADVNNNKNNPVIGDRSFGDNIKNVSEKCEAYARGMQEANVLACAKHFPGHGDTDVDSHYDLPKIPHSASRLDSLELQPFKYLIKKEIASIMVAHLEIPALDTVKNQPATLSHNIIQKLLKDKLQYKGLVFTDAMNMQGVAKHYTSSESTVRALIAGNDVVLMPQDLEGGITAVKKAIADKKLDWEDLNQRVKKVLRAKYKAGLAFYKPVDVQKVAERLKSSEGEALKDEILAKSLTLLTNKDTIVPVKNSLETATLCIGASQKTTFQTELERFGISTHYQAPSSIVGKQAEKYAPLEKYKQVVVAIYNIHKLPANNHNISQSVIDFIQQLSQKTKVLVVLFGTPYASYLFENQRNVVVSYGETAQIEQLTAQAVVGSLPFAGMLPISAGNVFKYGTGLQTQPIRMAYASSPEVVGMNSKTLQKIDNVAKEMITAKAAAGAQILVVKNGKIAFHKCYGHHTYDKTRVVRYDDIYDLASVTKICAATLSIMKLYEEGKIDIKKPLSDYIPELKGTNKEKLQIGDIMAHQAGLKPWIPFYTSTLDSAKKPMAQFYKTRPDEKFAMRVTEKLFFDKNSVDSIVWQKIYNAEMESSTSYKYSDLGFYLFTKMVQNVSGKSLDKYAADNFYTPMGLTQIGYNPLNRNIPKTRIVPTEQDDYFRYGTVHGDVHDMGAAMIGGVSGHAGLFSTAYELAAVMQLFVNKGEFFGKRYLKPETIKQFTSAYTSNPRRGLGFDRKEKGEGEKKSVNVAWQASDNTFGHLGFTGIGAWADPDNELVYIFLSNRTFPDSENNKLNGKNIRPRIHEIIYESLIPKK